MCNGESQHRVTAPSFGPAGAIQPFASANPDLRPRDERRYRVPTPPLDGHEPQPAPLIRNAPPDSLGNGQDQRGRRIVAGQSPPPGLTALSPIFPLAGCVAHHPRFGQRAPE